VGFFCLRLLATRAFRYAHDGEIITLRLFNSPRLPQAAAH